MGGPAVRSEGSEEYLILFAWRRPVGRWALRVGVQLNRRRLPGVEGMPVSGPRCAGRFTEHAQDQVDLQAEHARRSWKPLQNTVFRFADRRSNNADQFRPARQNIGVGDFGSSYQR